MRSNPTLLRINSRWHSCLLILTISLGSAEAATVHMGLSGSDANPGTVERPVQSINQAMVLAEKSGEPSEIIIRAGRYSGTGRPLQPAQGGPTNELPRIVIRTADGEKVIFDNTTLLDGGEAIKGAAGVYRIKGAFPIAGNPTEVWEEDTRSRYKPVADEAAVLEFPGSVTFPDETTMVFSTSDRRPLKEHIVRAHVWRESLDSMAFIVWRDNVTFRGLTFANYGTGSHAVDVRGKNIVIEDCFFFNCYRGVLVADKAVGTQILRCTGTDLGGGIYVNGKNTTIEHCRLTRGEGAFAFEMNGQDNSGIQYYHPAKDGTIRFNHCHGFEGGIYIKGAQGEYRIEHNTITGPGFGIYHQEWQAGNICRQNIFACDAGAIYSQNTLTNGVIFDENIIWAPDVQKEVNAQLALVQKDGYGKHNRSVDPLFVAADRGDLRLLSVSPAIKFGDKDGPVGAFPCVPGGFTDNSPPRLLVALDKPAMFNGTDGDKYLIDDPVAEGKPRYLRKFLKQPADIFFITKDSNVRLLLYASHSTSPAVQMKISLNGKEGNVEPFKPSRELSLPEKDGIYRVAVRVTNKQGTWSELASVDVILSKQAPVFVDKPVVRTSTRGAMISVRTDRPAVCKVEVDMGGNTWREFPVMPDGLSRWNDQDLARPDTYYVVAPKATAEIQDMAAVAIISGEPIQAGSNYTYRLTLRDHAGNQWVSTPATFTTEGETRTFYVSRTGRDDEKCGSERSPFATLQYALDRTLPGDTVRVMPGIYAGAKLFHGGLADAPITIEAVTPGTVVLDGQKKSIAVLGLSNAPWVVIRNLEVRWFTIAGIHVFTSPNVTISGCRIWNDAWRMWPSGVGIYSMFSPGSTVDHCLLYRCASGMNYYSSTNARIIYNTIAANLLGGFGFVHSGTGSIIRNNAICFTGNVCISIIEETPEGRASLAMDYNNYACTIRDAAGDARPKNNIIPVARYGGMGESKRVIEMTEYGTAYTIEKWRELSGKDTHSIYADPLWIDPRRGRFDVEKNSPNIGAGENGTTIGAVGYLGEPAPSKVMK